MQAEWSCAPRSCRPRPTASTEQATRRLAETPAVMARRNAADSSYTAYNADSAGLMCPSIRCPSQSPEPHMPHGVHGRVLGCYSKTRSAASEFSACTFPTSVKFPGRWAAARGKQPAAGGDVRAFCAISPSSFGAAFPLPILAPRASSRSATGQPGGAWVRNGPRRWARGPQLVLPVRTCRLTFARVDGYERLRSSSLKR